MQNSASFRLSYDGVALSTHEMDIKELAPALLAMGEVIELANKRINGDRVKIQVNLKATDEGSVDVALVAVQGLWDSAVTIFDSTEANAVVNAVDVLKLLGIGTVGGKGVIGLIKWIKGRNIKNVTRLEHGNVKIELVDGEAKVIEEQELNLFSLVQVRRRIESVVKPLNRDGIETIKLSSGEIEETITENEAPYFKAPDAGNELIDEGESTLTLEILDLSFRDGGKWRFTDGASSFYAMIEDHEFLDNVTRNEEAFAKDDYIKVNLLRKQYSTDSGIKTDYIIKKVLEHKSSARQYRLPFQKGE